MMIVYSPNENSIIIMLFYLSCSSYRMENNGGNVADAGVREPPEGVVQCEGIPRKPWMTKYVALQNDAGVVVGKGICHNVDWTFIIDSDNQPQGDDRVTVQIAEFLSEREVPSDWVFQLRAWHIRRVFLNGANLYDHEQMHLFRVSSGASCWRSRVSARPYESSRGRRNSDRVPKKEALLTVESIRNVSTMSCCLKNYLQRFPHDWIEALWSEMHVEGSVYHRKHRQLDVHKQIHRDADGRNMITLEGMEVCPKAWTTIMGVHRSSFY